MGKLPSTVLRRPSLAAGCLSSTPAHTSALLPLSSPSQSAQCAANQVRHATFVPRSRRPYQFTQLVQLSDGSTFTVRTTSPVALYKSAKDSRNHVLWQPTEKSLRNVEVDEAGKLAAFRERYGKAWDLDAVKEEDGAAEQVQKDAAAAAPAAGAAVVEKGGEKDKAKKGDDKAKEAAAAPAAQAPAAEPVQEEDPYGSLVDLISAYAVEDKNIKGGLSAKDQARKEKGSKKK